MLHVAKKMPPWWLITRVELSVILDVNLDVLAQKALRKVGPQPLPAHWTLKPKQKRVYRWANIVSEEPEAFVSAWLEANPCTTSSTSTLTERMAQADRAVRFAPDMIGLERRDLRTRPRLKGEFAYRLDNPNDQGAIPWDHPVLDQLIYQEEMV